MGILQNLRIYISLLIVISCAVLDGQLCESKKLDPLIMQWDTLIQQKEYEKSRDIAEHILEIDSTYCFAYILLGETYAHYASEISTKENTVERNTIFCLAIDMLEKAKNNDLECTEQANNKIDIYSYYLLSREEIFTGDIEGKEIMINGWINRKTIYRYKD